MQVLKCPAKLSPRSVPQPYGLGRPCPARPRDGRPPSPSTLCGLCGRTVGVGPKAGAMGSLAGRKPVWGARNPSVARDAMATTIHRFPGDTTKRKRTWPAPARTDFQLARSSPRGPPFCPCHDGRLQATATDCVLARQDARARPAQRARAAACVAEQGRAPYPHLGRPHHAGSEVKRCQHMARLMLNAKDCWHRLLAEALKKYLRGRRHGRQPRLLPPQPATAS